MRIISSFKSACLFGFLSMLCTSAAFSQAGLNAGPVELTIEHVAGSVYMIQRPGGGGNIGASIGPDGVLLVDSLFAPHTESLLAAVRQVTDEDIRFLINTHVHPDHIGGNENLAAMGVLIFAHDNARFRFLLERNRFPRGGGSFAPQPPEAARPEITFNDSMSFHLNGEEVLATLAPPAHTDGDVFVYFPESDVLHLGDVFRTTSYPIMDIFNGGSLRGTIAALDKAIEMAGPNTKVIPGHGLEVVGRDAMIEFRDMILDVREQVLIRIRDGEKLDQIMAANITEEYDAKWGQEAGWTAVDFVPIVYYELGGSGRLLDR
ncbi:MAG: cyclase [Pseudohongiella sp.]|nr:MAG: cyclase [Pseudohongiella sp.]